MSQEADDYDSPWKDALERYFQEFVEFFFPDVAGQIDWTKRHKFRDKELRQVVREAEKGPRFVDKLVEVARRNGKTEWVYIHVEVQGSRDPDFRGRMFTYHYRILDRYNRLVASLAVLADESPTWRPDSYEHELFGCRVRMDFPMVKLLDYEDQLESLVESDNAFGIMTAAHLLTRRTKRKDHRRFDAKWRLTRMLYERGWDRQRVLDLFAIIDWLMFLPPKLEKKLMENVTELEEEKNMPYVTSVERRARKEGRSEGEASLLCRMLRQSFGSLPAWVEERVFSASTEQIEAWADAVLEAEDLEDVFEEPE